MYETLGCFKQFPANFTLVLVPHSFNFGVKVLSDVVGGLILYADNPWDFHDET